MFLIDTMIVGGIRFVLDKIAAVVDAEMNDTTKLREQLLEAQMRVELGEMSQEEFESLESQILARLREIREQQQGSGPAPGSPGYRVSGVEASVEGDHHT